MDEHFLALRELRLDESHELVDLIKGRRREVLDADLLVLEAGVFDLEGVQTVALEAHDDGVSHLPETREVPFHEGRAREPCEAASVDRVVEHPHGATSMTPAEVKIAPGPWTGAMARGRLA